MHFRVFCFYIFCLSLGFALSWRTDNAILFVAIVYTAAHAMAALPDDVPLDLTPAAVDAPHQGTFGDRISKD